MHCRRRRGSRPRCGRRRRPPKLRWKESFTCRRSRPSRTMRIESFPVSASGHRQVLHGSRRRGSRPSCGRRSASPRGRRNVHPSNVRLAALYGGHSTPVRERIEKSRGRQLLDPADSTIALEYPREARAATSRSTQEPPAQRQEAGVALPSSSRKPSSVRPAAEAAEVAVEGVIHLPKESTFTDNAD